MPNWKKVAVSGSAASFLSLHVDTSVTASTFSGSQFIGNLSGTASRAISSSFALTASFASTASYIINASISGAITNVDYVDFNTSATVTQPVAGRLSWNDSDGTLDLGMKGGTVVQQIGEETFYEVRNQTGTSIPNGTSLYASGVTVGSGRITAAPFVADGTIQEVRYLGLATEDISDGVNGFVTAFGYVRNLDTRGTAPSSVAVGNENWTVGDILYAHPTVPGKLTNIPPKEKVYVAIVIIRNATAGVLFVRPSSYGHIDDLHDVNINTGSLSSGDLLIYDSGSDYWTNSKQLTGSYGLTGSLEATSFTGSLFGTASQAVSSSYALSSSRATSAANADTASYVLNATTSSFAISASYALSSSYALSASCAIAALTASYVETAQTASYVLQAISASFTLSSSYAATASFAFAFPDQGFNFTQNPGSTTWNINHNLNSFTPLVNVYNLSYRQLIPAEVISIDANNTQITFSTTQAGYAIISKGSGISSESAISASFATTASFAQQALSSSYAATASYAEVFNIGGSQMMYSNTLSTSAGNNGIFATNTGSFAGAFYQYTLYSGSNARSENATAVWTPTTSSYTNYSTIDVGNTSGVVGSVVITGGQIQLNLLTPTAGWSVRAVATFV